MSRDDAGPPPRALLVLRWLFSVFALLGAYSAVRALRIHHHQGIEPCFELVYAVVLLPLTWSACGLAWLGRWRGFVLLAMLDRAVSAMGALLFLSEMVSGPSYPLDNRLGFIAWNLASVGLSAFLVAYLARRFAPAEAAWSSHGRVHWDLRFLRASFTVASLAFAAAVAPSAWEHWTAEHGHLHSCAWVVIDVLVAALSCGACACAWLGRWRGFWSLGLVGQALAAFGAGWTMANLSLHAGAHDEAYRAGFFARNLPVFAFALFVVVYLSRRFPPRVSASPIASTTA